MITLSKEIDIIVNNIPDGWNKDHFKYNLKRNLELTPLPAFSDGEFHYESEKRFPLRGDGTIYTVGTDFPEFYKKLKRGVEDKSLSYNYKAEVLYAKLAIQDSAKEYDLATKKEASITKAEIDEKVKAVKFVKDVVKLRNCPNEIISGLAYKGVLVAKSDASTTRKWKVYHIKSGMTVTGAFLGFYTQREAKIFAMRIGDAFGTSGNIQEDIDTVNPGINYSARTLVKRMGLEGDVYVEIIK